MATAKIGAVLDSPQFGVPTRANGLAGVERRWPDSLAVTPRSGCCKLIPVSRRALLLVVAVVPFGCERGAEQPATHAPAAATTDAGAAMAQLEANLLAATSLTGLCHIETSGAVDSDIQARLVLAGPDEYELHIAGEFAGEPVYAALLSNPERTVTSETLPSTEPQPPPTKVPTPPHIGEALVIGLTRMGLMHNVAMLSEGALPDHAQGGVREWVKTVDHEWRVEPGGGRALTFALAVDGGVPSTAELVFDSNGWPARRYQRVEFPEGVMEVIEVCEWTDASGVRAQ